MMYSLRANKEFGFTQREHEENKETVVSILSIIKANNLPFTQALEVLELCKVELQMQMRLL